MQRQYPKGSILALGIVVGAVIGILLDDLTFYILLGIMFGLIGEGGNKSKDL